MVILAVVVGVRDTTREPKADVLHRVERCRDGRTTREVETKAIAKLVG